MRILTFLLDIYEAITINYDNIQVIISNHGINRVVCWFYGGVSFKGNGFCKIYTFIMLGSLFQFCIVANLITVFKAIH
jgi:hypothetical protein